MHSELKFQKKSIFVGQKHIFLTFSKVQKHIFCYFKNGKKSIFAPKKFQNYKKMQYLGLKKRQDFWTEITFFSTFQVIVQDDDESTILKSETNHRIIQPSSKVSYEPIVS